MKKIVTACTILLFSLNLYAQSYQVRIKTNLGPITVKLFDDTPLHRDNFLKLVRQNYYDSTLFHRVIKGFVIQAGDPDSKHASDTATLGEGDLGYTVPAEIVPQHYHVKGALGMARDNNPAKASSACQFYIVQGKVVDDDSLFIKAKKKNGGYEIPEEHRKVYRSVGGIPHLDGNYTVFGEVVTGLQIVDKIASQSIGKNDRPMQNVRILKTEIVKEPK